MAAVLTHKRGSRFSKLVTWTDSSGTPEVLGSAPRVQLRDGADELVQELTVTLATQSGGTTGQFTISATAAQTALWPVAALSCDVLRTDTEVASETFTIRVLQSVTR